jgi:hypothetical protein
MSPDKIPLCPKCTRPAELRPSLASSLLHDLHCKSCGDEMLTQQEFDRLVWVERSEIDWKPPE